MGSQSVLNQGAQSVGSQNVLNQGAQSVGLQSVLNQSMQTQKVESVQEKNSVLGLQPHVDHHMKQNLLRERESKFLFSN